MTRFSLKPTLVVVCGCDPQTHYECGCMAQGRNCPEVILCEEVTEGNSSRKTIAKRYSELYPNAYVHTWTVVGE